MTPHAKSEKKIVKFWFDNLVSILSITCLLYIVLYKLWFINKQEIFSGAYLVGEISYHLCLALVSSSIFYAIVVFIPNRRNKKKVSQVINMSFKQIEMMADMIYIDISRSSNHPNPPSWLPKNVKEFQLICKEMLLTQKPPPYFSGSGMIAVNDWYGYFNYNFHIDRHHINTLYRYSSFLNAPTMQLLHDLSYTRLKSGIRYYESKQKEEEYAVRFDNLSYLIYSYLELLKKFKTDSWI